MNNIKRVLIGSPVHQKYEILLEFLKSLEELEKTNLKVDYCFVDDNSDKNSSKLLNDFKEKHENVTLLNVDLSSEEDQQYYCDDYTHRWNNSLVDKVTKFKNEIIKFAVKENFDYLFFIDSDIVLQIPTLVTLVEANKDIISNVFWTRWSPEGPELPQVWVKDAYTFYNADAINPIPQEEAQRLSNEFINMLKVPGLYKVGGLGACTLISKKALQKGVNFNKIYNISFWGEDRAFCIRAAALGFELFVDTHYPAYHIYRNNDLEGVEEFKKNSAKRDLELISYQVADIVAKALINLETYSYKKPFNTEWEKDFTERERLVQKNRLNNLKENLIATKTINKATLENLNITLYDGYEQILLKCDLINTGYKNNYSYQNKFELTTKVNKIKDQWLIDELTFQNKPFSNVLPLIRKVNDKNKLTLSMIVKNEEGRYLETALNQHRKYIDNAIIIDDGSTDKTKEIIKDLLGDKNLILIENKNSMFSNEINLRKLQWKETIKTNPDWILNLDADEIFEDSFAEGVHNLIDNNFDVDSYIFRLYDFWDMEHYRDDGLWCAHNTYRPFLTRYQRNFNYIWHETAQHCGRFPKNLEHLRMAKSNFRLKHFGWAREEDRLAKYERYMKLDPNGEFGVLAQYKSILDLHPNITKWKENEN
ncbi:glycosyltransferase [Clostridium tarantellae]|uniref:Glycosyltransferase n=1 Tax=Clostridium tarantellae TaxID=39493 RepID=A0A6I1MPR8_9CLOT|nr:glycosyltransferase [Clostridium tarantellae]MPQ44468.1 glycosyltransferase [Clostridium tarantellae]